MDTLVVSAGVSEVVVMLRTRSVEETEAAGRAFGERLSGGELVLITGPLGAGKTAFVRGVATGAGSRSPVSSPTFVLEHHYAARIPLLHVDLYRLAAVDVSDLAVDDVLAAGGAVLVEWGERLPEAYRSDAITVTIGIEGEDEDERAIRITRPVRVSGGAPS